MAVVLLSTVPLLVLNTVEVLYEVVVARDVAVPLLVVVFLDVPRDVAVAYVVAKVVLRLVLNVVEVLYEVVVARDVAVPLLVVVL